MTNAFTVYCRMTRLASVRLDQHDKHDNKPFSVHNSQPVLQPIIASIDLKVTSDMKRLTVSCLLKTS